MSRMTLFQNAFRPLFLAAGTWAVVALLVWVCVLEGRITLPSRLAPMDWHIHEMLFGFILAGVGGFLLTAIPNWTSRPPVRGTPLAVLTALWLAGRIATAVSATMPAWAAVVADLAFPIALAALAARELLAAGNRRNYPLLLPVGLFGVANLLMHLDSLGADLPAGIGWRLGLGCIMTLIGVIGGRITPAFTRNWLRQRGGLAVPEANRLDLAAIAASAAGLLLWTILPDAPATGWMLLAAAALHLVRLSRWHGLATRHEPLLAALHLGYGWMAIALGLLGGSILTTAIPLPAAIHAMTAGAIGTMMLAVMARATLGHTGRALVADRLTVWVFALVGLAALARIAAAWPVPGTVALLIASALAWVAAFALFAWRYGPMMLRPRL